MTSIEFIALDFFFGGKLYVDELTFITPTFEGIAIQPLAVAVSEDWEAFEQLVQEHFHIPTTLNDTLELIGVTTVTFEGAAFSVGFQDY